VELRKTSLARITCDNGNSIHYMQRQAFRILSHSNPRKSCNSEHIPKINLQPWKENKLAGVVMQKRKAGNTPDYFAKTFDEYKQGFSSNGEIWLGLEKIHILTTSRSYGLVVKMTDWDDKEYIAVYDSFKVGAGDGYTLTISGFDPESSTLGDSMAYHNGMKFTTKDRDQDKSSRGSCSKSYDNGGWWFNFCHRTYPNGLNSDIPRTGFSYITWSAFNGKGNYWNNWKGSEFTLVPREEDLPVGNKE